MHEDQSKYEILTADPAELAALYAAGALTPTESAAFEQRLATGCPESNFELSNMAPVVKALARFIDPEQPPDTVRQSLLARVQQSCPGVGAVPSESENVALPIYFQHAVNAEWKTVADGVTLRIIFLDRHSRRFTALLRMAPGFRFAAHRHPDAEECFVLEGDLRSPEAVLVAGDYQRYADDTWHAEQWTEQGCLCLITGAIEQV